MDTNRPYNYYSSENAPPAYKGKISDTLYQTLGDYEKFGINKIIDPKPATIVPSMFNTLQYRELPMSKPSQTRKVQANYNPYKQLNQTC